MNNSKNALFCILQNELSSKSFHLNLSRIFGLGSAEDASHNITRGHMPAWPEHPRQGTLVYDSLANHWLVLSALWKVILTFLSSSELQLRQQANSEGKASRDRPLRRRTLHIQNFPRTSQVSWTEPDSSCLDRPLSHRKWVYLDVANIPGTVSREAMAECFESLKQEASFRRQLLTGELDNTKTLFSMEST